jgi:hypothetical protein
MQQFIGSISKSISRPAIYAGIKSDGGVIQAKKSPTCSANHCLHPDQSLVLVPP